MKIMGRKNRFFYYVSGALPLGPAWYIGPVLLSRPCSGLGLWPFTVGHSGLDKIQFLSETHIFM